MAWLTTRQYAEKYGLSMRTARNHFCSLVDEGKARKVGGRWRVEEEECPEQIGIDAGQSTEVLISSTLKGEFTWNI